MYQTPSFARAERFLTRRYKQSVSRGTLLLDTLIAMSVLAIVFAVTYPNYEYARLQSQVSASVQQMNAIGTALELYANDNAGAYPPGAAGTAIDPTLFGGATNSYFQSTPNSPFSNASYTYSKDGSTTLTPLITDPAVYTPKTLLNSYKKVDGTACAGTCQTLYYDFNHSVFGG